VWGVIEMVPQEGVSMHSRWQRGGVPQGTNGRRWIAGFALCFWVMAALSGVAGTIRMQVTCSATDQKMTVQMVNTGDENAQNVRATVNFFGQEYQTENISVLPPNKAQNRSFDLKSQALVGTYPARVLVDFEDLNSYPFSAVSIQLIRGAKAKSSPLVGMIEKTSLAGKAKLPLKIHNTSTQEVAVACRIVTPRELVVEEPAFTIAVPPGGTVTRTVRIDNFSGTPTSTYPVHLLMEHTQDGVNFCALSSGSILLLAPSPVSTSGFWIVAGIVSALAVVFLGLLFRSKTLATRLAVGRPPAGRH
jgi:hypothetical protein